jgi:hypothetical protein
LSLSIIFTVLRSGKATERTNDDYDLDDMLVSKAAAKKNEMLEDVRRINSAAAEQLSEGSVYIVKSSEVFIY